MSSFFALAVNAGFAALGTDALYVPADGSPSRTVRVIAKRPDAFRDFGDSRIATPTAVFDVRVADVPSPKAGDTLVFDGIVHVIQGEPSRDRERLVWTLDTRPQGTWEPSADPPQPPTDGGGF